MYYINISRPGILAACAAITMMAFTSACDDVKEDDRLIKVERPPIARKVLIQEFTGINCVNCPTGASMVHEIQQLYPESVIAVGMHPGGTGFSGPIGTFNLNSELARVYYDYYKPAGFPAAVIDGQEPLTNISTWSGAVRSQISNPAPADITMTPSYDEASRTLTVDYEVTINNVYTRPLNINIWLVENGIIGPQKSGSTIIFKYEHNHVLRTSLTGNWGNQLASSFLPEEVYKGSASIVLDENWVAENCDIIGFLQNDAKNVEQAAETPVLTSIPD